MCNLSGTEPPAGQEGIHGLLHRQVSYRLYIQVGRLFFQNKNKTFLTRYTFTKSGCNFISYSLLRKMSSMKILKCVLWFENRLALINVDLLQCENLMS